MSKNILAFLDSEPALDRAIEHARKKKTSFLLVISRNVLPQRQDLGFSYRQEQIYDYRVEDLDDLALKSVDEFWDGFLKANATAGDQLRANGILEPMKYSYAALMFYWYRLSLTIRHIVTTYPPSEVIADDSWADYVRLAEVPYSLISAKDDTKNKVNDIYYKLKMMVWSAMYFAGLILYPVIIGKILNIRNWALVKNCQIVLIGSSGLNASIDPIWQTMKKSTVNCAEMIMCRGFKQVFSSIFSSKQVCTIEGIIGVDDLFIIWRNYCRIIKDYHKTQADLYLNKDGEAIPFFRSQLDKFFMESLARSLLFIRVGLRLKELPHLKRTIFSTIGDFSHAMSKALVASKVETVSLTHGMVLEPLGYRSFDDLKITWGSFDADLLKHYSADKSYLWLCANPVGLRDSRRSFSRNGNWFGNLEDLGCFTQGRSLALAELPVSLQEQCALIFPSSNLGGRTLERFMDICLSHLAHNQARYSFKFIVVKIKKHRLSKKEEYAAIIEAITARLGEVPVILCQDADLSLLLKNCAIALCALSSIILDSLRCNVPFCVYTGGSMSDRRFISSLPPWMRFNKLEDLDQIREEQLVEFRGSGGSRLRELYWGKNGINLEQVVERLTS